jgi:hypothetical protein
MSRRFCRSRTASNDDNDNGGRGADPRDSAGTDDGGRNDYNGNSDTTVYDYDDTDAAIVDDSSTSEAAADSHLPSQFTDPRRMELAV